MAFVVSPKVELGQYSTHKSFQSRKQQRARQQAQKTQRKQTTGKSTLPAVDQAEQSRKMGTITQMKKSERERDRENPNATRARQVPRSQWASSIPACRRPSGKHGNCSQGHHQHAVLLSHLSRFPPSAAPLCVLCASGPADPLGLLLAKPRFACRLSVRKQGTCLLETCSLDRDNARREIFSVLVVRLG